MYKGEGKYIVVPYPNKVKDDDRYNPILRQGEDNLPEGGVNPAPVDSCRFFQLSGHAPVKSAHDQDRVGKAEHHIKEPQPKMGIPQIQFIQHRKF